MPVLWDAPLTAAMARELNEELTGARVRAVHMDRASRSLLLHFRRATLVFRLHPLHGDVGLLDARKPAPEARAVKAQLRGVHAPPDERLLFFQLQPGGGGADPQGIVVELMTNQWNAVWIDVATARIRRILWARESGDRPLRSGEAYRRPPPSQRRGIEEPLTEEEWTGLLAPATPKERRRILLRSVAFTSSLVIPALVQPDPGDPDAPLRSGHRLWLRLRSLSLGQGKAEPVVLRRDGGAQPYPLRLPHLECRPCDSLLAGFRRGAEETPDEGGPASALIPGALLARVEEAVDEAERKARLLESELRKTADPDELRRTGDLVLARIGSIQRGVDRTVVEGFDGRPVEVALDPSLSPAENAERFYAQAARAERAEQRLPELIRRARRRVEELRTVLERARSGEVDVEELQSRLPASSRGRSKEPGTRLPFRRYRSSGGLEIRVGRGARDNDALTFHHSSPDDVWLHARQVPGAHVILRWSGEGSPPARDLGEAAALAALHSDARHSTSVPVDWTRRKYVRSPRKAPPGQVVPERVRTLFVEPDPKLEKRLKEG